MIRRVVLKMQVGTDSVAITSAIWVAARCQAVQATAIHTVALTSVPSPDAGSGHMGMSTSVWITKNKHSLSNKTIFDVATLD